MRLDANKGDTDWNVWHAEELRELRFVLWIDDEAKQWAQAAQPLRPEGDSLAVNVFSAKRISILPARRLVIVNPIEDDEDEPARSVVCSQAPQKKLGLTPQKSGV